MNTEELLSDILNDRRSGSSRIIKKTLILLEMVDRERRKDFLMKIIDAHPSMAGLSIILKLIGEKSVEEIKKEFQSMDEKTVEYLLDLTDKKSVVVISRSHTVEDGLDGAEKVYVLCSEPGGEGRDTEKFLRSKGIEVELIPDLCMGYAVSKCDLVVVGADTILRNGFVNKVGTLPLALTAKHFEKKFYVASPSYKLADSCMIEIPFEFIPSKLVDSLVCEMGLCRIEEIWKAKDKQ